MSTNEPQPEKAHTSVDMAPMRPDKEGNEDSNASGVDRNQVLRYFFGRERADVPPVLGQVLEDMEEDVFKKPAKAAGEQGKESLASMMKESEAMKIKDVKEDIDTLLTFAGLFSAAVTALIIESYKLLQPDPEDAAVVLLASIARQLNSSLEQADDTQSSSSSSLPRPLNGLWFTSLFLSLVTASLAMLAKQWLREFLALDDLSYRPAGKSFFMRHRGLTVYRVYEITSILPLMLQLALALFLTGLFIFLRSLDELLGDIMMAFVLAWLMLYAVTFILPLLDETCPYKTPMISRIGFYRTSNSGSNKANGPGPGGMGKSVEKYMIESAIDRFRSTGMREKMGNLLLHCIPDLNDEHRYEVLSSEFARGNISSVPSEHRIMVRCAVAKILSQNRQRLGPAHESTEELVLGYIFDNLEESEMRYIVFLWDDFRRWLWYFFEQLLEPETSASDPSYSKRVLGGIHRVLSFLQYVHNNKERLESLLSGHYPFKHKDVQMLVMFMDLLDHHVSTFGFRRYCALEPFVILLLYAPPEEVEEHQDTIRDVFLQCGHWLAENLKKHTVVLFRVGKQDSLLPILKQFKEFTGERFADSIGRLESLLENNPADLSQAGQTALDPAQFLTQVRDGIPSGGITGLPSDLPVELLLERVTGRPAEEFAQYPPELLAGLLTQPSEHPPERSTQQSTQTPTTPPVRPPVSSSVSPPAQDLAPRIAEALSRLPTDLPAEFLLERITGRPAEEFANYPPEIISEVLATLTGQPTENIAAVADVPLAQSSDEPGAAPRAESSTTPLQKTGAETSTEAQAGAPGILVDIPDELTEVFTELLAEYPVEVLAELLNKYSTDILTQLPKEEVAELLDELVREHTTS